MRRETELQADMVRWLTTHGFKAAAINNGAVLAGDARSRAIQMATLKKAGLHPGFPDLIVFGPDAVGFIEVKLEGEYAEDKQMEVEDWLTRWAGQKYAVCRSVLDVRETFEEWGWMASRGAA